MNGTFFTHLAACRQLIVSLFTDSLNHFNADSLHLWGFLVELYAYLALVAGVTPTGTRDRRTVILDPFLSSLEFLSQCKTYGTLLGFGHGLFEIIPDISALAQRRQADKGKDCPAELQNGYWQLEDRICLWHYSQISASELDLNPE